MAKKVDYFVVKEPLYGTVINCYVGWKYKEMLEDLADPNIEIPKGYDQPELHQDSGGVFLDCDTKDKTGMVRIMWLKEKPTSIEALGTLVHECVHAGQAICKYRGISTTWDEPEPLAYYVQFVLQEILKNCKPKHAK